MLEKIKLLFAEDDGKALPIVNEKKEVTDPVYHFFVFEKAKERKKVYKKALQAAEADQQEVLRKYDDLKKDLVSI